MADCGPAEPGADARISPPAGCISLLGLEGGGIAESQISASSVRYSMLGLQRWGPELVRLHNKGLVNAWSAAAHDKNPWIEVPDSDGFNFRVGRGAGSRHATF